MFLSYNIQGQVHRDRLRTAQHPAHPSDRQPGEAPESAPPWCTWWQQAPVPAGHAGEPRETAGRDGLLL